MSTSKELGNEQFKQKNFDKAIEFYTKAIEENPSDHTVYGNRSASYHNLKKFELALADGEKCVQMKSDWSKGYQRKAMALHGLGRLDESIEAYETGLKLEPNNAQMQSGLQAVINQ
jgi:stress-induced-phosphoprotein 1